MTSYKPPKGPPRQRGHLERLIDSVGRAEGIAPSRIRRWLTMMVMIGTLDRMQADYGGSEFLVKGGVAIELRLGLAARATKDLDIAFSGDREQLITALETALGEPYSGFSFVRGEIEDIGETGACRLDVRVSFQGRAWATARVEISPSEGLAADDVEIIDAISIADFGLDGPEKVRVLSLRYQIAQKLHACTERFQDGENDRFRDLIDLLLIGTLIEDLRPVREACREIFSTRGKHSWPPLLHVPDSWANPFARLAAEHAFPIGDVHTAAERVRMLIASIEAGIPIRPPRVGQTWRHYDGVRIQIEELRSETAVVNKTYPETGITVADAIDPATFEQMVLIDDPQQPTWQVVVEARYGTAASDSLWRIGTIEAAGREIVSGTLFPTVVARVVAPDEAVARQLARAVLPQSAKIIAVMPA